MSVSHDRSPALDKWSDDAAILAQEFSSLLTVLLGNAEYMRDHTRPGSSGRQRADDSVEAAHRSIALLRWLLTVSGSEPTTGGQAGELTADLSGEDVRSTTGDRILLVEDDDLLRDFVVSILESMGYRVVPAENGPHALALLDEYRDFDLLFTDVVMPGDFNGLELVRRARQLMPNLPILLTSGYHDRMEQDIPSDVYRIHKPFRRDELRTSLNQCLGAARRNAGSEEEAK